MTEERTLCRTPTPGKKATTIPTWKFDAVREAILALVPAAEPGIAAKDLPAAVRRQLPDDVLQKLGSVSWHTTTVKLEMEVSGELKRVAGKVPQHLVRGRQGFCSSGAADQW